MKRILQQTLGLFILSAFFFNISATIAHAKPIIDWELENGFKMFLKAEHTQIHRNEYKNLTEEEKKNPVLSIERRLSLKYEQGWANDVFKYTCWNRKKRTYTKCRGRKKNYLHPKSHSVIARLKSEPPKGKCLWAVYDRSKTGNIIYQKVEAFCNAPVKFNVPYPLGANIVVMQGGKIVSSEQIKVKDIFVVGIGDSIASAEGNPDRPVTFNDKKSADYGVIVGTGVKL